MLPHNCQQLKTSMLAMGAELQRLSAASTKTRLDGPGQFRQIDHVQGRSALPKLERGPRFDRPLPRLSQRPATTLEP
jgi:hypothetical protein